MLRTGWTERELAAASPSLVSRLHWRLIAETFWTDDARELYGAAEIQTKDAKARARHARGRIAAHSIHDYLFPEDD